MNSTQSIELGTGTFRKPRRSSILPPEMQKQVQINKKLKIKYP